MDKIVLDASVVLAWLEEGAQAERAVKLREAIVSGTIAAWAPDFLLAEVANILLQKKHATANDAQTFVETVLSVGISFDEAPNSEKIDTLITVAATHGITIYDAQYLALAQKLECKLVSFDRELLAVKEWVAFPRDLLS